MRNPWTTKNPFMSAWLSAANQATNSARGAIAAESKRQTKTAVSDISQAATKAVLDFWSGGLAASRPVAEPKRKPRAKKR
ncbi:MAG: hypothetical protein RLZZ618_2778 [Pseudomonadota bacterium]|jgi:hypothetical protein